MTRAGTPHAFGGALALAYYAEPRATNDIDLNLFIAPEQQHDAATALAEVGVKLPSAVRQRVLAEGQCRVRWGNTPVDLFFANHAFHDAMRSATRSVPFGNGSIPILGADHLVVCKALFNRPKDWLDIEGMLKHRPPPNRTEVQRWMTLLVGAGDRRTARLAAAW